MSRGLFELRKDSITGWWVAVVVDREFDRARFHRPAKFIGHEPPDCANCREPGDGVRVRNLKPRAFTVAGTEREARERGTDERDPELGLVGDSGSWQTIIAPTGHHESFATTAAGIGFEMLARAREQISVAREAGATEYVQVVQNWGRQAGARTDHLCLDFYDLPQIPHRIGEELGGAARYLIREGVCPFCRLVRDEVADASRLLFEDATSVCFAPWASRSPFELWVVPRHHAADFSTATDAQLVGAVGTLQRALALLGALGEPPYNLLLHTAPLKERVDETYHWHWEIHPRLREIAGLELGTGLPVNPVSPEDVVADLLAVDRAETADGHGPQGVDAGAGRSWDLFRREVGR